MLLKKQPHFDLVITYEVMTFLVVESVFNKAGCISTLPVFYLYLVDRQNILSKTNILFISKEIDKRKHICGNYCKNFFIFSSSLANSFFRNKEISNIYIFRFEIIIPKDNEHAQDASEILPLLSELFEVEELRSIAQERINKIKKNIDDGNTSGNDYNNSKERLCHVYLRTSCIDEILPPNILLYIFSYLKSADLEWLPLLSHSFRFILTSSASLYKTVNSKKKKLNNDIYFVCVYTLALSEPQSYIWKRKIKENLMLEVDHADTDVTITINDSRVKSKFYKNVTDFFNCSQFPWYHVRKWSIKGYDNLDNTSKALFINKPFLLYRSLFDPNSSNLWRNTVCFWRTYTMGTKKEKKNLRRKIRKSRRRASLVEWLKNWYENGFQIGKNHGFIDYSSIVSLEEYKHNILSDDDYQKQSQFLFQMMCPLKKNSRCCKYLQEQLNPTLRYSTTVNSMVFCITDNGSKIFTTDSKDNLHSFFTFQHSLRSFAYL
ncbi:hypothetical protein RFI_07511 [Reticulomyxa filosa]|uniref:F-box domain-containing protein n=1 Tax=Reticulomyxa filosa TaxID=46433 RepID=X6NUL3_RETFI|nr:hypothetical protein RFI_07511 [Reticulomyxa filosa]|eukprot:ETO29608.1 hypothetical protein RFI_07511 [Reticulomyxa filosa]